MVMRPSNHSPKPVPTARPAEARLRAGVFREGAALFGRGLENPPNPIRSAPTRSRGGRVCSRRPWGSGTGAALFGGGLGEPPQPLSAPPRRGVGVGGSAAGDLGDRGRAHGRAPLRNGDQSRSGGESREGVALFGGGVGVPPPPPTLSAPPRRGVGVGGSAAGDLGDRGRAHGRAPLRNGDQSRSGGRVQRGRSPLWWGCGGTPPPTLSAPPRRGVGVGGRLERGLLVRPHRVNTDAERR